MSAIMHCKNCNANIEIPDGFSKAFIKCPTCQKMTAVTLPASPRGAPSSASTARRSPPSAPPAAPPPQAPRPTPLSAPASSSALPEIMKANKRVAGQNCTVCQSPIQLGEEVHNCPKCSQPSHQNCWNRNHGCGRPTCADTALEAASSFSMAPTGGGSMSEAGDNQIPCRWCKELIIRGAKKCKHCGEFQSDADRDMAESSNRVIDETDDWGTIILWTILAVITTPFCAGLIFLIFQGLKILVVMFNEGCGCVLLGIFVPFYSQYFVWTNRHTLFENKNGPKVWVCTSLIFTVISFLAQLAKAGR